MKEFGRTVLGFSSDSYFCGGISDFFGYRLKIVCSNRLIIIAN